MRITDELREYTERQIKWLDMTKVHYRKLLAIADRIDAEHEMATSEFWAKINAVPATDENMAEHGWVRLPKDADGEYIHVGDRMENNERVARIVLTDDSWEPSVYLEKLPNVLHEYFCNEISHYHAPTVEDVLFESLKHFGAVEERTQDVDEWLHEQAKRLQLRGDAE